MSNHPFVDGNKRAPTLSVIPFLVSPAALRGAITRLICHVLGVLSAAKILSPGITTKSGLMVGLGERNEEVHALLERLREAEVDIVTIGQDLLPSRENLPVGTYVPPDFL